MSLKLGMTSRNGTRKLFVSYLAAPSGQADMAPLLWCGAQVLLDPGDERGKLVPVGMVGDASVGAVMPAIPN